MERYKEEKELEEKKRQLNFTHQMSAEQTEKAKLQNKIQTLEVTLLQRKAKSENESEREAEMAKEISDLRLLIKKYEVEC